MLFVSLLTIQWIYIRILVVQFRKKKTLFSSVVVLDGCVVCCLGGRCCNDVSTFLQGKGAVVILLKSKAKDHLY